MGRIMPNYLHTTFVQTLKWQKYFPTLPLLWQSWKKTDTLSVSVSGPASVRLCTLKDFLACMSGDVNDVSLSKFFSY